MLRPERMSKVSVTGSKRVIDDVIEAAYEHHSLHVTDYDESYEGFEPGSSLEGAEEVNEKLVTVRSLESILDVEGGGVDDRRSLDDEELDAELDELQERVNDLNDRRDDLRAEIRDLEDEIDRMEPFAELGIELDLLRGYDSLEVVVGEAKTGDVEAALADAGGIEAYEVFAGDGVVAAFARPAEVADEGVLQDALVGVDVAFLDVPDADGSPGEYVAELEAEVAELEGKLEAVEEELAGVEREAADFLLRAEEQLTIEAQKKEAPLSFATTENAFVAEGWIPTDTYTDFAATITESVGDHAEVEELERATFTPDGDHHAETVHDGDADAEVATDGGHATVDEEPPVVQNNGDAAGPFELLVQAFGRPKYSEFDPTLLVFLTFPLMFGFMIGDIGYGVLYVAIGAFMYRRYEGTIRELGAIGIWAGLFTVLFGIYYGIDLFGYHAYQLFFEHWPVAKGLSPGDSHWALAYLVLSVLFGILHLNVGYVLSFVNEYQLHDVKHALYESGSWLLLLNGIWMWIFSQHFAGPKPAFLFDSIGVLTLGAVSFPGLPVAVGFLGIAFAAAGFLLLAIGEPTEIAEVLEPLVNVISYARIMAVLLAKAGMALAVNLLAFGAYMDSEGYFHFIFTPEYLTYLQGHPESYDVIFPGISTAFEPSVIGVVAVIAAILVAAVGHVVVLVLGITSAGIQSVRLEYVEFFGKFFQGGGDPYRPFGYDREYTGDE